METKKETRIESVYPLSPMQEGMLFHKLLNEDSTEYVVRYVMKFDGELDIANVRASLELLSEKYDILRTAIAMPKSGGRPWQVVLKDRRIELNVTDLSNHRSQEEQLKQLKQDDLHRGFDLEKDSLLRMTVIRLSSTASIGLWSFHHIILDGWCSSSILVDFFQTYALLSKGAPISEMKEKMDAEKSQMASYSEFIKWLEKQNKQTALNYWSDLLRNYSDIAMISPLSTTMDANEEMDRCTLQTSHELTAGVKQLAKQKNITINTILESVLGILLHKYNRNHDAVFGKVVSGRNANISGIDKAVGLFINTIPVRVKKSANTTFEQVLEESHKQAIESSSYDYCSLADIQRHSSCGSDLIQVLFVYENYFVDEAAIAQGMRDLGENLRVEIAEFREQTNYPLTISVSMDETLELSMMYDPRKFSKEEINLLLARYQILLQKLVERPGMIIDETDVISAEEQVIILEQFNDTRVALPRHKTVVHLFEEQAATVPHKIAVRWEGHSLTYAELNQKANQLAVQLRELGVKPDDLVAVIAERRIETIIAICGIIKAGGVYVPIDPAYPRDRIAYMLEDGHPKAVLAYDAVQYDGAAPVIGLSEAMQWEGVPDNPQPVNAPGDLIYVMYTSGTTGRPKGVMIEHRNVIRLVYQAGYVALNEDTVILQTGALGFDAATFEIWGALLNGGELVLGDKDVILDAKLLTQVIEEYQVNTLFLTTSLFNQLIDSDVAVFDPLRTVVFGGEKASDIHVRRLAEANPELYIANGYGPTETTTFATWYRIESGALREKTPIGKPLPNTQTYVLNGMQLCGLGMAGELCIAGDGVGRGYLNHPELTADKFVDNPFGEGKIYRTGDLVRWRPDGNLEYLGRIDEQVKLRGFRIELGEIEAVIRKINGVQDAAVIMREDNGEKHICAYIVAEAEMETGNIREELRKELPDYMIPAFLMKLEKLPVTANGKLDRRALPQIELKSEREYVAPRNEQEEAIVQIFREVLGIEKIGLKDNFFELGGDSIKAIRVVSKLRGLDYHVTMREIIQQPSIELIIARIDEKYNQDLAGGEAAATSVTSARNRLAQEKGLEVNTIAVLEDMKFDPQSFAKTKIYKELMDYDHNMSDEVIIDHIEPFAYQKYFLIDEPYNVCCAKTIISGSVDPEELLRISREIIKEQSICRWSYRQEDNCYLEYTYTRNWHVPYIDLTQCERLSEELKSFESISSVSKFFTNNQLLAKILIVKAEAEKHLIYFYAQHAVWDFLSTEVLGNLIIDKLLGIREQLIESAYGEYVKSRKRTEDDLQKDTRAFVDRFLNLAKNYEDITRGQTIQYFLDVHYKMKPGQADEILKNPIQWGVKLFALINMEEPSEANQTLPFILIRFNRENAAHTTLGLYLDSVLQVADTNGWTITPAQNSRYSYALFEPENLPKEVRNNYFGKIPAINFVTAFDPAYQFEEFGEFKMEIKNMPEMIVTKGYISIRIINDVLHLLVPSFGNERERMETVIKCYLEQS